MKTIIIILAVLLFLFLLSLIKIVFIVEYKNGKFETKLKILFFTINTKKKKVPKKKAEKLEKKRPDFKAIIDIIKKLREILKDLFSLFPKKLLKHIIIEKGHFYFWFNAGRADRTAMGYAAVSTAVFGIYGILQKYVTVKKFDVNIMPEYVYETTAELEKKIYIRILFLFRFLISVVILYFKNRDLLKEQINKIKEITNGKPD